MTLTLYVDTRHVSPYVFACFVTLTEKKLAYTMKPLDFGKGETRSDEYLGRTITGRVPGLVHDDFGLAESTAIIEYLEDSFPDAPVLPASIHERARCRQLMSWLRSDETAALREERSTDTMFYARATAPLSKRAQASADKVFTAASRLLRPSAEHLFSRWTIVDAELAYMLHRLIVNGDAVPPHVKSWADREWQRRSIQSWVTYPRLNA